MYIRWNKRTCLSKRKKSCVAVREEKCFSIFFRVQHGLGWLTVCSQELEVAKRAPHLGAGLGKRVTVSLTFINSANNDTSHRQWMPQAQAATSTCLTGWITLLSLSLPAFLTLTGFCSSESNVNIYLKSGGPQSRYSKSDSHLTRR